MEAERSQQISKYVAFRQRYNQKQELRNDQKDRQKQFSNKLDKNPKQPQNHQSLQQKIPQQPRTQQQISYRHSAVSQQVAMQQAYSTNIRIARRQAYRPSRVQVGKAGARSNKMLRKLQKYEPYIKTAAARYNLPEELIAGVIWQESRANPRARSPVGAMGLMQLMPATAKMLGVRNAWNPAENIDGGAKYLRQMIDKFGGRIDFAVAAYNAGPGNVKKYGGIPPFKETQNYVPKVVGFAKNFKVAGGFPYSRNSRAVWA